MQAWQVGEIQRSLIEAGMRDRDMEGAPRGHGGRAHLQPTSCCLPPPATKPIHSAPPLSKCLGTSDSRLSGAGLESDSCCEGDLLRVPHGLPRRKPALYLPTVAPNTEISERFL